MSNLQQLQIEIPEPVANLNLPMPELISYYKDESNRVLWLDSDVDETWINYAKLIMQWNREDIDIPPVAREPICLMIHSYGGSLDMCMLLCDVISRSKTKIFGVNFGKCASAAAFIYIACHKRFIMPHATVMLHKGGINDLSGTAEQVESFQTQYKKDQAWMIEHLLAKTNIQKAVITKKMRGDWYISAQESLELGISDAIIDDIDEIL